MTIQKRTLRGYSPQTLARILNKKTTKKQPTKKVVTKKIATKKVTVKKLQKPKQTSVRKTTTIKKPITKKTPSKKIHLKKVEEEKPKRNMSLVIKLDQIETASAKRNKEQACYVDKDSGKCLFCVNGTKNSVTPNDEQISIIKKKGKQLIVTHNHPAPYDSSITGEDLQVAIGNDSAGVRAITKKWTYVAMRPKDGWKISWIQAKEIYDDIFRKMERQWNDDYQNDRISKYYYEDNLTHKVMEKVAKKIGFTYFRFKN